MASEWLQIRHKTQKPTLPNSNSIGNSRATGLSVARLLCATLVKHSRFILFIYFKLYFKIDSYLPDLRESVIFPYISLYTQAVAYTTYVESAARRALENTSKRRLLSLGSLWMPKSSFFWSMAAILGDVVVRKYVRRTRPRVMPLATMTMKTQTHGVLNFYPCTIVMGLRSAALRAAGELRYNFLSFFCNRNETPTS